MSFIIISATVEKDKQYQRMQKPMGYFTFENKMCTICRKPKLNMYVIL